MRFCLFTYKFMRISRINGNVLYMAMLPWSVRIGDICRPTICHDSASRLNILLNNWPQRVPFPVWNLQQKSSTSTTLWSYLNSTKHPYLRYNSASVVLSFGNDGFIYLDLKVLSRIQIVQVLRWFICTFFVKSL